MKIQTMFALGMKREIPELLESYGDEIELGPGHNPVGCPALEYPEWDADYMAIPYPDESMDVIHMYHFLEHVEDPIKLLRECERVLKVGGHINIVVPHKSSALAWEDLDHKTFFNEETIPKLLITHGYDKNSSWELQVHANFIMAIVERNLSIFTQLRKR